MDKLLIEHVARALSEELGYKYDDNFHDIAAQQAEQNAATTFGRLAIKAIEATQSYKDRENKNG